MPALIYYFQEFARGATILIYHNDRCTVGIAAHQAARKGRPRVAADAGEGPPPPRTKAQRGKKLLLGLRAVPALIYYFRELSRGAQIFTRPDVLKLTSDF